jgi:hypothetical protein
MATFQAIAVTGNAVKNLLQEAWPRDVFPGAGFRLCNSALLASSPFHDLGVSIYLYSVTYNTTRRNLPPRLTLQHKRFRPSVPLDLHFLVTAWGRAPEQQWALLAWAIRTLEDSPVLPAGYLNQNAGSDAEGNSPEVFREDESVELVAEALSLQDIFDIWEICKHNQQPSVSFVARSLQIDSMMEIPDGSLVQTRAFDTAAFDK